MSLTGPHLAQITQAILEAYDRDSLRRALQAGMNVDFDHYAAEKGFAAQVQELVKWANLNKRALELLNCACRYNPDNMALSDLWQEAQAWREDEAPDQPVPPDISGALHINVQQTTGDVYGQVIGVQIGTYNAPPLRDPQRELEQAYLGALIRKYKEWEATYTALEGIVEVRSGISEPGTIPIEFKRLSNSDTRHESVTDLRYAVNKYRRLVILGEPGAGKTTTLWRLTYDYAIAAQADPSAPMPFYVPLGGYSGPETTIEYVKHEVGQLAGDLGTQLPTYLLNRKAVLLLDALNEMPRDKYVERVNRIQKLLNDFKDVPMVVTCRALDYIEALNLEKLEVKPLDEAKQLQYLAAYLGPKDAKQLLSQLAQSRTTATVSLSDLAANPYLLRMFVEIYRENKGVLPQNRGKLFEAFTDTLLEREQDRHKEDEFPGVDLLRHVLAELAFAMQIEGEYGTSVSEVWVKKQMRGFGFAPDKLLYYGRSATLLDISDKQVRFVHQLLQEYFAAVAMQAQLFGDKGNNHTRRWRLSQRSLLPVHTGDLRYYWPQGWHKPSGWDETVVLLAGITPDLPAFIEKLTTVNPAAAIKCIAESGEILSDDLVDKVQGNLVEIATGLTASRFERNAAGNALNFLCDPRPGVGVRHGLPDIIWCHVPAGEFLMGSNEATSAEASDTETSQHRCYLNDYWISKYPITNSQYQAYIDDRDYQHELSIRLTEAGMNWEGWLKFRSPRSQGGNWDLPNHPALNVSWFEAVTFCEWLSLKSGHMVRIPCEAEWEKAARGIDGRCYPWGNTIKPEYANYVSAKIEETTAVGVFPRGASPYGVMDMMGNTLEWAISQHERNPYCSGNGRERLVSLFRAQCVLRGGSFDEKPRSAAWSLRRENFSQVSMLRSSFRLVTSLPPPSRRL